MDRVSFSYKVSAWVEITRGDLALLKQLSAEHYDAKCRRMSAKASGSAGTKNGVLTVWELFDFDEPPEGVTPDPNETTHVEIDRHVLGTLIKITEPYIHTHPRVQETLALHMKLRGILHETVVETERIVGETPKAVETPAHTCGGGMMDTSEDECPACLVRRAEEKARWAREDAEKTRRGGP